MRVQILILISLLLVGSVFGQSAGGSDAASQYIFFSVDTDPSDSTETHGTRYALSSADGNVYPVTSTSTGFSVNRGTPVTTTAVTGYANQIRTFVTGASGASQTSDARTSLESDFETDLIRFYGVETTTNGIRLDSVTSSFLLTNHLFDVRDTHNRRPFSTTSAPVDNSRSGGSIPGDPDDPDDPDDPEEGETADGVVITTTLGEITNVPAIDTENQRIDNIDITSMTTIGDQNRFNFDGGYFTFETTSEGTTMRKVEDVEGGSPRTTQITTYTTDADNNRLVGYQLYTYNSPTSREVSSTENRFTYTVGDNERSGSFTVAEGVNANDQAVLRTAQALHQAGGTNNIQVTTAGTGTAETPSTSYGGDTWYAADGGWLDDPGLKIEMRNGNTYTSYGNVMEIRDTDGNTLQIQVPSDSTNDYSTTTTTTDFNSLPVGTVMRSTANGVTTVQMRVKDDNNNVVTQSFTQGTNSNNQRVFTYSGPGSSNTVFTETDAGLQTRRAGQTYIVRGSDLYRANSDGSRGERIEANEQSESEKAIVADATGLSETRRAYTNQDNTNRVDRDRAQTNVVRQYYNVLEQAVEGARTMEVYTSLFLGDDFMNDWKYSVDETFASLHLGSRYWVSSICENKLDQPTGQQVAFAFSNPYNAYNPNAGVAIVATCTGERQVIDNPFQAEHLYKFTYYVKNPQDEESISYNVILTHADGEVVLFNESQVLEGGASDGRSGRSAIVDYSNKDYTKCCVHFQDAPMLVASSNPVCNTVVDVTNAAPTQVPGAPGQTTQQSGGAGAGVVNSIR